MLRFLFGHSGSDEEKTPLKPKIESTKVDTGWETLPLELWILICYQLAVKELGRVARVSKKLKFASETDDVWIKRAIEDLIGVARLTSIDVIADKRISSIKTYRKELYFGTLLKNKKFNLSQPPGNNPTQHSYNCCPDYGCIADDTMTPVAGVGAGACILTTLLAMIWVDSCATYGIVTGVTTVISIASTTTYGVIAGCENYRFEKDKYDDALDDYYHATSNFAVIKQLTMGNRATLFYPKMTAEIDEMLKQKGLQKRIDANERLVPKSF